MPYHERGPAGPEPAEATMRMTIPLALLLIELARCYTALGEPFSLAHAWRVVPPIIAMSGIFAFGWTASVFVNFVARYNELRAGIMDLLSLATTQCNTEEKLAGVLCCLPQAMVPGELSYANSFRVVILQFLDRYNFDLATVKRRVAAAEARLARALAQENTP